MPKVSRTRALLTVALLAIGGVVATGLIGRWYVIERPLPMNGDRVEFRVPAGSSWRATALAAHSAGIDVNADAMVVAARVMGTTQTVRAGRYAVERGITLGDLLARLQAGEVLRARVTVVDGITFDGMRALLASQPELEQTGARMSIAELLKAIGAAESHPEGLFSPGAYIYDTGSDGLDICRQAYRAQSKLLQDAWANPAPDLPYKTAYEALIMASIVEKETSYPSERTLVAAVFVNRLRLGMPLQSSPTVIYGLGDKFDGILRERDLLIDGPYNTHTRAGLPPTPIALPGRASIEAALQPAQSEVLYFVARGDGTSQFSTTLAEHNRAVHAAQRCCLRP